MSDSPKILYKYRNWTNCYHRKLITDLELFFSSPISFNDPFDFQITYRYDLLSRDERKEIYRNELIKNGYSGLNIEQQAEYLADNGPLANSNHLKMVSEYQKQKMNTSFGIVSLSTKPDSILMWSHYGDCHRGFCVGFNVSSIIDEFQVQWHKVHYENTFPELIPIAGSSWLARMAEAMHTKFKDWVYESEYRFVKFGYSDKAVNLNQSHYKSLIFGCAMPVQHKEELKSIVQNVLPKIEIYECGRHETDFRIVMNRIN